MSAKKILLPLLRVVLVLAALIPIVYATVKDWAEVRAALATIRWLHLLGGLMLLTLAMPLVGSIPWLTLRHLGTKQPLGKVMGLYFISQLAKYLPGGIWVFPGRVIAYQASGIGRSQAIISISREVVAFFLGAAAVGLLGLFLGLPISAPVQIAMIFGLGCCLIAIIFTQAPQVWQIAGRIPFLRQSALAALQTGQTTFSLRWLPDTFAVSLVFWLAAGLAFRQLVVAVTPETSLSWLQAASIFALAWCLGFIIVVLPAGFGAREAVISFLLAGFMPTGGALSVALLSRLWWMAAEALCVTVSLLWLPIRSKDTLPTGSPVE